MDEKKQRIKVIFNSWMALVEERKEINNQMKDLVNEVSKFTEIKQTQVRKTFSFMKKLNDQGVDELEGINALVEEIK